MYKFLDLEKVVQEGFPQVVMESLCLKEENKALDHEVEALWREWAYLSAKVKQHGSVSQAKLERVKVALRQQGLGGHAIAIKSDVALLRAAHWEDNLEVAKEKIVAQVKSLSLQRGVAKRYSNLTSLGPKRSTCQLNKSIPWGKMLIWHWPNK